MDELMAMPVSVENEEDFPEPKFDFSLPEDVFIEVDHCELANSRGWQRHGLEIVYAGVLSYDSGPENVIGAASYEAWYGSFLDYTIEGILEPPPGPGFYVVEDVTADYHRGDGWATDDDMDFYAGGRRFATLEEIAAQHGADLWECI